MSTSLFDQPTAEKPVSTDTALVEHKATTPMDLLQMAVDKSFDPDRLRALMDLQREWQRDRAEEAFAAAMHECQSDMPPIAPNSQNQKTKSRYANLEAVQSIAKPIYTRHGFSLSYGEADCPIEKFKRTVCDVRHIDGACHRYHLDLPIDGVGAQGGATSMNAVQGCISTTSYGQRRLLCMIFNITIGDEDNDGQTGEKLTEEQIDTLRQWIETIGADIDRVLKWRKVEKLADIPADDFLMILNSFKDTARKKGMKVD